MKRYFLIFIMMLTLSFVSPNKCDAQVYWYKTTSMAIKAKQNGYWSNWSDWQQCTIAICMNLDRSLITIYSNNTQYYKIVELGEAPYDDSGKQILFYAIDGDGDRCTVRLRVENATQNSQIYIDFSDVMWVYNVYRTE